jgi:hypothetical protein
MKKTILFLTLAINANFGALAQTFPYGINYQALARDANGNAQLNQQVPVQFTIYKIAESSGNIIYQERQLKQTNSMGQFNAVIGQGTPVLPYNASSFSQINWSTDSTFLKVELNANVSFTGAFTAMGPTTRFQSVPYSMLSAKVVEKQNLTLTGSTLALSGSTPPSVTIDPSSTNELPAAGNGISVSGNTVSVKSVNDYAVYMERYPTNSPGVPSVAGWNTRNLNYTQDSSGSSISRAGNIITLTPGKYFIKATGIGYEVDHHVLCLRTSSGAMPPVLSGLTTYTEQYDNNTSTFEGYITITSTQTYKLDHYTTLARGTGLGTNLNIPGVNNIFSYILIQKIN